MNDEKHNDPIERLFERKLEDYNIPYDEKNWQRLEERLDKADAIYYSRRKKHLAAAVLVLLLCVMAYFTLQNHTKLNRLSEQLNEAMVSKSESEKEEANGQGAGPQQNAGDPAEESAPFTIEDSRPKGKANGNQANTSSGQDLPAAAAERSSVNDKQSNFQWSATRDETEALFVSELTCPACVLTVAANDDSYAAATLEGYKAGMGKRSDRKEPATIPSRIMNPQGRAETGPRVALGFMMAPDLSTAGAFSHFENPGFKIGFSAELRLTSRLALRTGVIHSNVRYTARGSDYIPPEGYWTDGIAARETFAECALLDIPLSLKYEVMQFDRSGVFITAGLSSYIMLNEEYRFAYEGYEPGLKQEWSDRTGTRHWFSNAGFSVGYQWDIHPSWALQVEPFINVPLSRVGWGNVELYSVGSFVSFSYKF